eukprot:m.85811 g.85811  ORF g.85811 m.85811 type:complete len:362 (+) comp8254_c0_seq2:1733-2818(+)
MLRAIAAPQQDAVGCKHAAPGVWPVQRAHHLQGKVGHERLIHEAARRRVHVDQIRHRDAPGHVQAVWGLRVLVDLKVVAGVIKHNRLDCPQLLCSIQQLLRVLVRRQCDRDRLENRAAVLAGGPGGNGHVVARGHILCIFVALRLVLVAVDAHPGRRLCHRGGTCSSSRSPDGSAGLLKRHFFIVNKERLRIIGQQALVRLSGKATLANKVFQVKLRGDRLGSLEGWALGPTQCSDDKWRRCGRRVRLGVAEDDNRRLRRGGGRPAKFVLGPLARSRDVLLCARGRAGEAVEQRAWRWHGGGGGGAHGRCRAWSRASVGEDGKGLARAVVAGRGDRSAQAARDRVNRGAVAGGGPARIGCD